jgi:hypothetical protein
MFDERYCDAGESEPTMLCCTISRTPAQIRPKRRFCPHSLACTATEHPVLPFLACTEVHDPGSIQKAFRVQEHPNVAGPAGRTFSDDGEPVSSPEAPLSAETRRNGVNTPQVWGPVPLRNPDFVGREQLLEQLSQRLLKPGATAVLPEALHGMGGIGKTQTVVEYIYQHASEYDVV